MPNKFYEMLVDNDTSIWFFFFEREKLFWANNLIFFYKNLIHDQ